MKLLPLVMCGCAAGAPLPSSRAPVEPAKTGLLWKFSPDGYMSETSFSESYYGPDLVLFHNRRQFGGLLVAIDPRSGSPLWRRSANWVVHPPDRAEPLWIVDDPPNEDHKQIIRLDPRTGRELARISVADPIRALDERLAWADGRIVAFAMDTLHAIDVADGSTVWTAPIPIDAYLHRPVVANHTIVVQGPSYVGIDTATGAIRWRIAGACCTALASPDGHELYLRKKVGGTIRVDWNGQLRGQLAGELMAVSNGYVAVQDPRFLAVYRHGEARPMWTLPTTDTSFVTAVALHDDALFYFAKADAALWRRELTSGRTTRVATAHDRLVISPDATGVAPAFIGTPPVWAPPYLFVDNWGIDAYGVP